MTRGCFSLLRGDAAAARGRRGGPGVDRGARRRSITGCWRRRWPGWPRTTPPGCGTRAPGGPGCGSPSTRPPTRGRTRGAPRAGSTCTTAPAAARAPARPRPAGSTSSPRQSGTCAPRGPRSSTWRGPRPRPARPRRSPQVKNLLRRLARRRARPQRRAAVRLRRRLQRRRPRRRPPGLPGPPPGPARSRQRVLRRPRHLGGQVRPPSPARRCGALPGACGLHRCRRRQRAAGPDETPAPEPRT